MKNNDKFLLNKMIENLDRNLYSAILASNIKIGLFDTKEEKELYDCVIQLRKKKRSNRMALLAAVYQLMGKIANLKEINI